MIFAYFLALIAAILIYVFTSRFGRSMRIILALVVFVILAASITFLIVKVGDDAAPGSVTVYPEKVPE